MIMYIGIAIRGIFMHKYHSRKIMSFACDHAQYNYRHVKSLTVCYVFVNPYFNDDFITCLYPNKDTRGTTKLTKLSVQ